MDEHQSASGIWLPVSGWAAVLCVLRWHNPCVRDRQLAAPGQSQQAATPRFHQHYGRQQQNQDSPEQLDEVCRCHRSGLGQLKHACCSPLFRQNDVCMGREEPQSCDCKPVLLFSLRPNPRHLGCS